MSTWPVLSDSSFHIWLHHNTNSSVDDMLLTLLMTFHCGRGDLSIGGNDPIELIELVLYCTPCSFNE